MKQPILSAALAATAAGACGAAASFGQVTQGPSSSATPYVVPLIPGVQTRSILTVGDTPGTPAAPIGTYRMAGIPDGLGAYDNGDNTFTLLMNHELGFGNGAVRAHGQNGAFVSEWTIDKATLGVSAGRDLITTVVAPVTAANPVPSQLGRLCSADLAAPSAYFNPASGLGTSARLFLSGEEVGNEGRAFGHVATGASKGTSYDLPRLGKFSWENAVANPLAQDKTVVVGTDDSTPGQVYVYVGNKTNSGTDVDRAGLTNGNLYGVRVNGIVDEPQTGAWPGGAGATAFTMFNKGDVTGVTGAQQQANSEANSVTEFRRPEDGQWDPRPGRQSDFYFVTTNDLTNSSRLFRMRFGDAANPEAGGTIEMVLDGNLPGTSANGISGGGGQIKMMDNMTIDSHGRVLIQEDPGGAARSAKVWMYDIDTDQVVLVAEHDRARFGGEAPGTVNTAAALPVAPFNNNEEASGIIDARDILGDGWFLMDVQAHYAQPGELVEGGQLLAMYVDPTLVPEPASLSLLAALGGVLGLRRRRTRGA